MNQIKIEDISFEKLDGELEQHENEWIAISDKNEIVASGLTYRETLEKAGGRKNVVLFKVPPLNVSFAP